MSTMSCFLVVVENSTAEARLDGWRQCQAAIRLPKTSGVAEGMRSHIARRRLLRISSAGRFDGPLGADPKTPITASSLPVSTREQIGAM
jgi:hypothetical protein